MDSGLVPQPGLRGIDVHPRGKILGPGVRGPGDLAPGGGFPNICAINQISWLLCDCFLSHINLMINGIDYATMISLKACYQIRPQPNKCQQIVFANYTCLSLFTLLQSIISYFQVFCFMHCLSPKIKPFALFTVAKCTTEASFITFECQTSM